jgi:hypothetical protein
VTPEQQATADRVTASKLLDAERWVVGYTQHSATAIRRRALAAGNGHK